MIKRHSSNYQRRLVRSRSKTRGSDKRPRLTVFRSNQQIYAQIINDQTGTTLVAANSLTLKSAPKSKLEQAVVVGQALAKAAKAKKIDKVVFDKGAYKYHGRIKALADAARKNGLQF